MHEDGYDPAHDEEIRHHLEAKTEFLVAMGWSEEDARREAVRAFGDESRIRRELERVRRGGPLLRAWELVRSIVADAGYALRSVRSAPVFTVAVVATIGLGIGSSSVIFAVTDALLLRPLPYRGAASLVEVNLERWQRGGYTPGMPVDRVGRWREAGTAFADDWVEWSLGTLVRVDGPQPEELAIVAVTPGADTLLGIPLLLGRGLSSGDAVPGAPDVAVLSRGYYERLGADPSILGNTLRMRGGPVTVVGVLRGGIRFPTWGGDVDLWVPIRSDWTAADRNLTMLGGFWSHLREGVELPEAQRRADDLAGRLQAEDPLEDGWAVRLEPVGAHRLAPDEKRILWTLAGTVGALLLIACVNGVNLALVRAGARRRELGIRLALGGSRARLLRLLLIEGLALGVAGGLAGLAFALASMTVVRGMLPWIVAYSSPFELEISVRVLGFTFALACVVGCALGLVPASELVRHRGSPLLPGRARDDGIGHERFRRALVLGQVALSMTLLAMSGMLLRSFVALVQVDPGYDHERLALADVGLPPAHYPEPGSRMAFVDALDVQLRRVPGVESVSYSYGVGFRSGVPLEAEGEPVRADQPYRIPSTTVALDYIQTTGTQLIAGRGFVAADVETDGVVIDRDMARFLWRNERPIGRRFRLGQDGAWMTVVGVVRELRLMGRDQREGPYQILRPASPEGVGWWIQVAVRVVGDPRAVLPDVRRAVRAVDPQQTIWRLRSASDALAEAEEVPRFVVGLIGALAAIAVLLALLGLYGVMSYSVSRRRRELGVRIALGAERGRVRRMVLGEGVALALGGVGIGVAGTLVAASAFQHLLYEVSPRDPLTLAAASGLFMLTAAAAALAPARRATAVDPVEALRAE